MRLTVFVGKNKNLLLGVDMSARFGFYSPRGFARALKMSTRAREAT